MHNLNNKNKKNNSKVTARATFLSLIATMILAVGGVSVPLAAPIALQQSAEAQRFTSQDDDLVVAPKAPVVVSGDNIYIAWWTNNTENGNEEVMFRASNDGGATFGDRINLSNTTDADSWRVELHGEGDTVVVSWWETNQTSDIPVARVSTDGGGTFGSLLMLSMNGTISGVEEEATAEEGEGEDEAAVEEVIIEEAVGEPEVAE